MSRSPAIAAAASSLVELRSLVECLEIATEVHPADDLPGLWGEVCAAEEWIRESRSIGMLDDYSQRLLTCWFHSRS